MFARTALALIFMPALLAACGESEPVCKNNVIREALAPDGQLKAVLFQRACGGPTGLASQVSILPAAATEMGKGNTFIADTASGIAPAAAWGGPDVGLEWTGPRAVTLSFPSRARVIDFKESVNGVAVSYNSKD